MPTYTYSCPGCGEFEEMQSITAPALEKCPQCGEPVKRLVGRNINIIFKGSGFYTTDSRGTGVEDIVKGNKGLQDIDKKLKDTAGASKKVS